MSKQDRQGVRTPADLERKYNFGKSFAEIMGVALDARESVDKVESELRSEIVEQVSSITRNAESIAFRVAEAERQIQEVETRATTLEQTAEGLELSVVRVQESLNEKADQTTVNEITEHFLFTEDGLTVFNSATGMGINVSEEQVAFTGGQDPTTVITPNQMETTKLVVGERLDLGAFSFLPRSNGNLSFRYVGGS